MENNDTTLQKVPKPWLNIIAVVDAGELGAIPVAGYIVVDDEGKQRAFRPHCSELLLAVALIKEWRYIKDVRPDFDAPENEKFLDNPKEE